MRVCVHVCVCGGGALGGELELMACAGWVQFPIPQPFQVMLGCRGGRGHDAGSASPAGKPCFLSRLPAPWGVRGRASCPCSSHAGSGLRRIDLFLLRSPWPALGLPECLGTPHYLHIRQVFAPPNAGKLKIALLPSGPVIGGGTAGFDKLRALANCHPLSLSTDCLASPALPFPADFHWAELCVEP